ncbi:MAG TPA: HAMP domain-containing sensor histidine kinase [Solirubrobacteraceae bacterium]|nr:HAMP domain-containing sensor histidine kinase [Solirubrobacteraceae bacterium]
MASPASSIRSAARATSSAYRRVPIRWRLAGGSALLTLIILCGFAVIVGVLTTGRIVDDFDRQVQDSANRIANDARLHVASVRGNTVVRPSSGGLNLASYAAAQGAAIRVVLRSGYALYETPHSPDFGPVIAPSIEDKGWRVETRIVNIDGDVIAPVYLQYARRLSDLQATVNRVRLFVAIGVLGGALLALLAGLATARRAMEPISELTEAARRVARTRDPSVRMPRPEADDEVAELARTLEEMLNSLNEAREETEATLDRQREFVADASHELRTPLTSVLANLELLEEELQGEQREAAASALRSSRRMRRLVGDLLLLARADAGRAAPHQPVDLSEVVTDAASELEPVAGDHEISVAAEPGAQVEGVRDELHRLVLNLMENALRHTDPGTAVEASVERRDGEIVLAVEDDGPGIPAELEDKVFERFFRGEGDRSGSSGLGLSIVRAVADSHHGSVALEPPLDGRGARFVVRLPALRAVAADPAARTA